MLQNISLDNLLFLLPALTGPIFIFMGFLLLKKPPKKINNIYGYRSKLSRSSDKNWAFAQTYSAKQMMKWGVIITICSGFGILWKPQTMIGLILGMSFYFIACFVPYFETEKKLKELDV